MKLTDNAICTTCGSITTHEIDVVTDEDEGRIHFITCGSCRVVHKERPILSTYKEPSPPEV